MNTHNHTNILPSKCHIADGVYLVEKPEGPSSFQFLQHIKRVLKVRKIGHAGTLDPLASGLMIVGVEKGTRKLKDFFKLDKTYRAKVVLGESRMTGDREGEIIEEREYRGNLSERDILRALESLSGEHSFPAPLYSAVKVQGKPLYAYAREGKTPPFIPQKPFSLISYELISFYEKDEGKRLELELRLRVGSGTYIRTFAEEFGKLLNYPAFLASLRRESIGPYSLDRACDMKSL